MKVEGTGTTLTVNDKITATGTNNSITINDSTGASATGVPSGVSISGVQTATVNSSGSIGRVASGTTAAQTVTLTYTASTSAATSVLTVGGIALTVAAGATDSTGVANGTASLAAAKSLYAAAGYNVITTGTPTAGQVLITAPTTSSVLVTAAVGQTVPSILISAPSNATQLPAVANAAGTTAVTAATYDVSGWTGLNTFTGTGVGDIDVKAAATTALTLTGSGAVTVNGGGGASQFTSAAGAVSIGGTATVANNYTSVTVKGTSTTVAITDRSGLLSDGVTVAVGSSLSTVSVTGNTGLATITGNGVTTLTMAKSSGGATVVNATAGHALALNLSGVTAGTVTDDIATSIAITTSASTAAATGNTLTGLAAAKAAAITVAGTKSVDLGTISATKLATVTITGTGGVTANVSSAGATTTAGFVTSVDTTGSTAVLSAGNGTTANNITIGTSTTFTGGASEDNLTVGASTKALSLGGGNDKLILSALLATGSTADGGTGTDTIEMSLANAATAGSSSGTLNAKISNFEKLSVIGATLGADTTVDLGYLAQVNSYVKVGAMANNILSISNFANAGTLEIAGANTTTRIAATVKDAAFSTTNSFNLKLTSSNALIAAGTVLLNDVETINIQTNNSATTVDGAYLDTMTLSADAVTGIVVTGNAGLNLTYTGTTATSVDASGIASVTLADGTTAKNAFTWASGALTSTANTPITVTGTSSGVNTISLDNVTNGLINSTITVGTSAADNVLTGGAGIDTIIGGSGNDTITGGGNRDVITTGAGNDIVVFATTAASRDRVTDFTAGSGGQADAIKTTNYVAADDFFAKTAAASSFSFTLASSGSVLEFAFAANSLVSLGDGSANSLDGTNLLKGLYDGNTAASIAIAAGKTEADVTYIAAYQDGKSYIYKVTPLGTPVDVQAITANEIVLVGILDGVATGALTSANFVG